MSDTRTLYKMWLNCGRMGDIEGLFIATPAQIESLMGRQVYFGEVLGKHSDIAWTFTRDEDVFEQLTQDQDFIDKLRSYIGDDTITGFNPFDYLEDEEDDESEDND